MDVAKFSACFCHQSINNSVCKSLVGTYDGRYFSVENSLRLQLSSAIKRQLWSLPFVKGMLTRSSSTLKNSCLLHWLVSLSYVLTESPWGRRRMKVGKSYGVICHRKR